MTDVHKPMAAVEAREKANEAWAEAYHLRKVADQAERLALRAEAKAMKADSYAEELDERKALEENKEVK